MSDELKTPSSQLRLTEDEASCASKEPYALRALGDSMEPEFPDGCVIIIEPATTAEIGNYVVAELEDEGFIFRRLSSHDGNYFLTPVNREYPSIAIKSLEVIRGVIVQRSGTRSHHRKHYL